MFGFKKSPAKIAKQNSVDPGFQAPADSETDNNTHKPARRTSSEPMLITPDLVKKSLVKEGLRLLPTRMIFVTQGA